MTQYWLKLLVLAGAVILFFAAPTFSSTLLPARDSSRCDSIFLSNGKAYAVKSLSWNEAEVSFAFCDDPANQLHAAPWMQIHHLKKADGLVMDSPAQKPTEPILTQAELSLENKVANLNTMAILTIPAMLFLGPIGIVLALIVLARGAKLSKAILGHPSEKFLLKRVKRSMRMAKVMLLIYFFLALLMFGYLIYFFSLFEKNQ